MVDYRLNSSLVLPRFVVALAVLGLAASARGATIIEFIPTTASPNITASANTGAYGSNASVSVGYSGYTYNYTTGYGGLDSGSGDAIYSDNTAETLAMTFTAAPGYTVTLVSFNLAQYTTNNLAVNISVTGGASSYSLTATTPAGGTGNFTTYSPNETGTSLTLTVTNLYDVGANTFVYSSSSSAPEPSAALMAAMAGGMFLFLTARHRRKTTA